MLTIAKLFGKSPFAPLLTHMRIVSLCIEKLSEIFEQMPKMDPSTIEKKAKELSKIEHEADVTKNDIRNHLPRSIFLPIDRSHFLDILSIQDSIADLAEEIALLLSLHPLEKLDQLQESLLVFYKMNLETFLDTKKIIEEIDALIESSFGGIEAEKVKAMVEKTALKQEKSAKERIHLLKKLFSVHRDLSAPSFYLWASVIEKTGEISHLSERLANRIRMILELK